MALLEAEELYRFYHRGDEEVKALRGVHLALDAGEMVALVGPSGSGKSTLLHCLAGLDEPDGGTVRVMDQTMTRQPEHAKRQLRSRYMGIMRQKDNLFPHLSILENAKLAQQLACKQDDQRLDVIFRQTGLADRVLSSPPQLSGGERARAGLAVALAAQPKILLLDEPTGEVDAETETAILQMLSNYRDEGGGVVVATHNPAVARLASETLTMKDGKILNA
jgi:putative ABC transport system ATP-binding protein